MGRSEDDSVPTTLAAGRPGDALSIRRILFDDLRTYCERLDMREGESVRIEAAGGAHLRIVTAHSRRVLLERDWARFIEVARLSSRQEP
jgi:hypothetical protein